jgi:hypothetical protein
MPIEFDFDGARKSGATDKDISEYFKTKYSIDFDIEGAKKNGANDSDILDYLNTKYSEPIKKKEPTTEPYSIGYKNAAEAIGNTSLVKQEKPFQSPLKTAGTTTPSVSTKGIVVIPPQPRLSAEEQQAQGIVQQDIKAQKAQEFKQGVKEKLYNDTRYWRLQDKKEAQERGYAKVEDMYKDRESYLIDNYLDDLDKAEASAKSKYLDAKQSGDDKVMNESYQSYLQARGEQRKKYTAQLDELNSQYAEIEDQIKTGEIPADFGKNVLDRINQRKSNLELTQKGVIDPKQAMDEFIKENSTQVASVAKPSQTPYEKLREYTNALYTEVLTRREELGLNEHMGGLEEYAMDYKLRTQNDAGKELDDLYAKEQKLKQATKLLFLNRTSIEDESALGVMGKNFVTSLSPATQGKLAANQVIANNLTSIAQDADISKNIYKEQQQFAEEEAKDYTPYSAKWFAAPIGSSLAIAAEFVPATILSEGVLGFTRLGRILNIAEEYGKIKGLNTTAKYINAVNKYKTAKAADTIGKFALKTQANALKFAATSEAVAQLFPSQQDEVNATTGYFGGAIGKGVEQLGGGMAATLFKVFGNKAPQAAKAFTALGEKLGVLKDAPKVIVGELGEEFGESLGQIYSESDSWKQIKTKLDEQFGTLDKATQFVIQTGIMALGMGSGTSIGSSLLKASKEAYNGLPREERAKVDSVLDSVQQEEEVVQNEVATEVAKELQESASSKDKETITTKIKEAEKTDEQRGTEEPISGRTDVAEEGLGVAIEPSGEGVAGEGVQAETVPQAPVLEVETPSINLAVPESPYNKSLRKLGYADADIEKMTIEQKQNIAENKIEAPIVESTAKVDSIKENAKQERIAEMQAQLDQEATTPTTEGVESTVDNTIAADYLTTGGIGTVISTDYLLRGIAGFFTNANTLIDDIRNKYAKELSDKNLVDIKNFVGSDTYIKIVSDIKEALNKSYNNSAEIQNILDELLKMPTGMPQRIGFGLESRHNAELAALESTTTDIEAKKADIEKEANLARLNIIKTKLPDSNWDTLIDKTKKNLRKVPESPTIDGHGIARVENGKTQLGVLLEILDSQKILGDWGKLISTNSNVMGAWISSSPFIITGLPNIPLANTETKQLNPYSVILNGHGEGYYEALVKRYPNVNFIIGSELTREQLLNAKYDAELAALGKKTPTETKEVVSEGVSETKPTKAERKAIAEAKIDDLAAKAKEFLRNKNLPEGTKKAGIGQDDVINVLASTVKALVNSGIEISEAIKQVREYFEKDFDTSAIKDYEISQAIARDELTDIAKENGFSSYREAVFAVNKYVRKVGAEDVITEEEIIKAKEAKAKESQPEKKKGFTPKKKKEEGKAGEVKQRAFATSSEARGGISPESIPDNIKNYTTTSVEEQVKIAKDLIERVGVDNAITLLTDERYRGEIDIRNIPVLASELLKSIYKIQNSTKDESVIKSYANDANAILQATVVAAGNSATLMSMMREFYNSNPYNYVAQVTTLIKRNNAPLASKIIEAVNNVNNANKQVASEVASKVAKKVSSTKVSEAKERYNKSKANLKAIWNKGLNVGISANKYEQAKNDVQFAKALAVMAKDFVVYQSVKFDEFLKEVADQLGIKESEIDQSHLKNIFNKAKSEKISSGVKVGLKELELKLKDLIESHYTTSNSIEDSLVEKLKDQFGLNDTDAAEVEKAIRYEVKVLTAKEKIKALNAQGIKNKEYIDELLALSEVGLLDSGEILKTFGKKLGIQELTKEEADKLLAMAKEVQESKEDRIIAKNIQKFEDYKFVLSKKYGISDFLISNYLTNIFGSVGANLMNIANNVSESVLLTSELLANALTKGNPSDIKLALKALYEGSARGFDFTKEVLKTGVASYKEPQNIHARNMWELIMDREVNLTGIERWLQKLFKTPYIGNVLLNERRFWNRALLSMDSLSGTTNLELGALWKATKEANRKGLKGKERSNFIAEQMASTPAIKEEAVAYAISLGYKEGTKEFRRAVANYLVSKRPEAIKEAAASYSSRATLTQEPPLNTLTGQVANILNKAIAKNQKLKFIFPVVNTFANLVVKNIERSPFEFFSLGLDVAINKAGGEYTEAGLTEEEIARRLKAATVSTAVAVLLFMLAGGMDDEEGEFEIYGSGTGDPKLDNERKALGWKPNTIRFSKDGGYYNFEFLPVGFLLSMVGNMRDYFKYKDEEAIKIRKAQSEKLFGKTLDSLTTEERNTLESELLSGKYNVSEVESKELANAAWQLGKTPIEYSAQLFKSLGDLMGIIGDNKSPKQKGISFGANIVRGNIAPRYLGEVRDIFDPKLYDSKEFWNTAAANVPFIKLGNVKLDGFGRDIEKYEPKSAWSGLKYAVTRRFYNPSRGTEVDQFLWENRISVGPPNNSARMAYPEEYYRKYIVLRGQIAMGAIQEAIKNKSFEYEEDGVIKEYTPQQKAIMINEILSKANELAGLEIDNELGRNNIIIE